MIKNIAIPPDIDEQVQYTVKVITQTKDLADWKEYVKRACEGLVRLGISQGRYEESCRQLEHIKKVFD